MLQAKVENQSVSAADVERMSQERQRLKEELNTQETQKQAILDDVQKFEADSAKVTSETESLVTKYCDEIAALGLLGSGANNVDHVNFLVTVDKHADTSRGESMLSQDMGSVITPALKKVKQRFT